MDKNLSEINIDWKSKVSNPEYAIAFIETLKGHISEHLAELADKDARISDLESQVTLHKEIADAIEFDWKQASERVAEQDRKIAALRDACKFKNQMIETLDARREELETEARFLVDRLREWEADGCDCDRGNREWLGHVSPSLARLEGILSSDEAPHQRADGEMAAETAQDARGADGGNIPLSSAKNS